MVNLCSLIYIVTCLSYRNEVFFMIAVQQLPSDSVEGSWSQPWKEVLSIWICIIRLSIHLSIHLPLLYPLTGSLGRGWACPSSLWAKDRGTCQLVSGQTITSNVNFKSPIRLSPKCISLDCGREPEYPDNPRRCRGEHADSTQRRTCGLGASGCEVTVLNTAPCCPFREDLCNQNRAKTHNF